MARASSRPTRTTLVIGQVKVPIGLYGTVARVRDLAEFETAGPNGGALMYAAAAKPAELSNDTPVREARVEADPFASTSGDVRLESGASMVAMAAPGEFRQVLVEDGSGEVVERADVRRGVRLENGTFVDCTEHLTRIEAMTTLDSMTVVEFIDVGQIERARIQASYFVGAQESLGLRPLRLIHEAMRRCRRVAVVRWTAKSRQSLGVLTAHRDGLVLLKLAWSEDWRDLPAKASSVLGASVSEEEIEMAVALVQAMSGKGGTTTLDDLRDDAIVAREDLRERALAGELEPCEPEPEPQDEVDFMEALRRSVAV